MPYRVASSHSRQIAVVAGVNEIADRKRQWKRNKQIWCTHWQSGCELAKHTDSPGVSWMYTSTAFVSHALARHVQARVML